MRLRVNTHENGERATAPDEAFRALAELFSNLPSAPSRRCRKYVLENLDGEPVFRLADNPSKPTPARDEIGVALDEVMLELFGPDPDGNEIVPQKLWVYQRLRRIAARLRAMAIKKVDAKSVLHMATSPAGVG